LIDKADLRVHWKRPLAAELQNIISIVGEDAMWQKSRAYDRVADLTKYGIPAAVSMSCKLSKFPNHKIEVRDAGEKSYSEIVSTCARIFKGEPETFSIVRADLTADVPETTVQWFRDHTYFAYKRIVREWSQIPVREGIDIRMVRHSRAQTLYGGKSPNQNRIYDKVLEQFQQYEGYCRKMKVAHTKSQREVAIGELSELVLPTFEQWCDGKYRTGQILTRVERACHGRDLVKLKITDLESLRSADRIRPFDKIRFRESKGADLSRELWGRNDFYIGDGMRRDVELYGLDQFMEGLRRDFKSNWRRHFNKYEPFIRSALSDYREVGTDPIRLQAEFERSTRLQMAA